MSTLQLCSEVNDWAKFQSCDLLFCALDEEKWWRIKGISRRPSSSLICTLFGLKLRAAPESACPKTKKNSAINETAHLRTSLESRVLHREWQNPFYSTNYGVLTRIFPDKDPPASPSRSLERTLWVLQLDPFFSGVGFLLRSNFLVIEVFRLCSDPHSGSTFIYIQKNVLKRVPKKLSRSASQRQALRAFLLQHGENMRKSFDI